MSLAIKFSKKEKLAGAFVLSAVVLAFFSALYVAYEHNWFSPKVGFSTTLERVEGIFPGTRIEMSGLKIGSVTSVEFQDNSKIKIQFAILRKNINRVHEDSVVRVTRPFIIGDKILDLTSGTMTSPLIKPGAEIPSETGFDIFEILDGRTMTPYMKMLGDLSESLKVLGEALSDKNRANRLVSIFDRFEPFLKNATTASLAFTEMSTQMTRDKQLQKAVANFAMASEEFNKIIQSSPDLAKNFNEIVKATTGLATSLNALTPEMPKATKRAVQALDEAVIVLKAMQKSFLLRSSVKEVKEEERQKKEQKERIPASSEE